MFLLPSGDGDETKVWYPLGLGMGMRMNFFYGNGYGIAKPVPASLLSLMTYFSNSWEICYSFT